MRTFRLDIPAEVLAALREPVGDALRAEVLRRAAKVQAAARDPRYAPRSPRWR